MTIRACFHCVMRILVSVTASNILFQTTTDKPVYLPHLHHPSSACKLKCTKVWTPGSNRASYRPSRSPYTSQVVIVWQENWWHSLVHRFSHSECHDNIVIPFLYLELKKPCRQWKLQLGLHHLIWHKDIYKWPWGKQTFTRQHSMLDHQDLYEFTWMPFGLSNAGASFCHLMEMCLEDQQYLTFLFYLDDICTFGSSSIDMRCWTGLDWCSSTLKISI